MSVTSIAKAFDSLILTIVADFDAPIAREFISREHDCAAEDEEGEMEQEEPLATSLSGHPLCINCRPCGGS